MHRSIPNRQIVTKVKLDNTSGRWSGDPDGWEVAYKATSQQGHPSLSPLDTGCLLWAKRLWRGRDTNSLGKANAPEWSQDPSAGLKEQGV